MSKDTLITPLYEREDDSVPGPFYVVKGLCLHCALSPETAPDNISWGASRSSCPHHCRIERQPADEAELSNIIDAACGSCVEAIRYCGTDPAIIARFRQRALEKLCDALQSNQNPQRLSNK